MTDSPLHFTIRELQHLVRSPLLWPALAGVALVLGLVGPFGTYDGLGLPTRLGYWAAVVSATYFTSAATVHFLERIMFRHPPGPGGHALLGGLSGLPVSVVVWCINWAVFDGDPGRAIAFAPLLLYATAIAAVASGLIALFAERFEHGATGPGVVAASSSALMKRLPPHLRGRLRHMSMQDHYVEVNTDKGSGLILMRLGDAIAQAEPVAGLRIHRSHWVARDAVSGCVRRNGRLFLVLSDGAELPVSRRYVADVRNAGLV